MRATSSSSSSSKPETDFDPNTTEINLDHKPNQPRTSGAYIRSLVKQLRTKDSSQGQDPARANSCDEQEKGPQKKRMRRRAQTRKPYQERLLNMAEARREIVSALKLHRASMKQARGANPGPEVQPFSSSEEAELESRRNPRVYDSNSDEARFNWYAGYSPGFCYSWPVSSFLGLDFALPSQTLGLNLNLDQDFNQIVVGPSSSIYSSSSPSTSSSPPLSAATTEEFTSTPVAVEFGRKDSLEIGPGNRKDEDFVNSPFDEVIDQFPEWMNADESCLQHMNDLSSHCNIQDPALPW